MCVLTQLVRATRLTRFSGLNETSRSLIFEDMFHMDHEPVTVVLQAREKAGAEWEDVDMEGEDLGVGETFIHAIQDISRRGGQRKGKTWRHRRVRQQEAWGGVFEPLVRTYLDYTHAPEAVPPENPVIVMAAETLVYTVDVICLFSRTTEITVTRLPDSLSPALDLMRHGYLAKTPSRPTIAVSLKTLELLYRLRQRKASYSVEAFTKVLCDYYQMPYRRHLREVLGDTFELYLRIIRHVDKLVHAALGWDGPDWRPKNACRACCYVLDDEPPLTFSRLYAMDGNNSLKRMATTTDRTAADTRVLDDSTYFLSRQFVDQFAKEVQGREAKGPAVRRRGDNHEEDSDEEGEAEGSSKVVEGDPTDGLQQSENSAAPVHTTDGLGATDSAHELDSNLRKKLLDQCVDNWKSAAKEESKRMWSIFDESGIFASACRHGLVLWLMDMVKSGELAKYPLATVAKVLESIGQDTLGGYDIGCAFLSTVQRSSLGPAFQEKNSRFCVCAFHGYSHCHTCQMRFHPNNLTGAGLEDLETMERIFSASNQLASVTRYASPYQRRLFIEAYFRQWDEDKSLNTGTFILSNYRQALEVIEHDGEVLREAMESLGITEASMDEWEHEELGFFARLGDEDDYDVHAVAYVELLQELRDLESKRAQVNARFLQYTPSVASSGSANYCKELASTRRLETDRRHAMERYERISHDVCALEVEMGLTVRWTPYTEQYKATLKYIKDRKYHRALNKLQKLVTQRLFELHKLNVAQTGYKMRTHIAKSLQTRCKTIQRAVKAYNAAAAMLDPPRPALDWSNVARLNVEVRRLHTAIRDESQLFDNTLRRLDLSKDPIFGATADFVARRKKINNHLLRRIDQVYALKGFTGVKVPGTRLGGAMQPPAGEHFDGLLVMRELPDEPLVPTKVGEDDDDGDEPDTFDADDDEQASIDSLIQFVSELAL
ncbi:hypothetical protein BC835DRAFT_1405155 [Cytidiella melzeri]|nr:hypothetical protein BC835DRAFT_1405155 [Cytidiella melzeri]